MNAKLCKSLRHVARLETIGKPLVGYYVDVDKVRVKSGTTRGAYLKLKRLLK